jgi:acyl carrier protein
VRASRETRTGSSEERLIGQLWSALGVDPKTTPGHMTLGELGMESMFAVELQQGLEREYDIKLSLNDVKNVTVKQMKDFQSGNKEILRNLAKEIKLMRVHLSKIKFIIPVETHTKLNNAQNGNPIYFLPPVEGIFSMLENLAKKINRPVIGLNWTQDMKNLNSIKEISTHYTDLLKKLSPNGNYDIVGHSLGAMIVSKMLRKAPIGRAVIIDVLSNTNSEEDMNSEEYFMDSFMKSIFLSDNLRDKISRDLSSIKGTNEKLKKFGSELREFGGKSLVDKDLDEIMINTSDRSKMVVNYRMKTMKKFNQFKQNLKKKFLKSNGKLFVIKPFEESDESNIIDKISECYFLPEKVCKIFVSFFKKNLINENFFQDFKGRMDIETVNANPNELLVSYYDKLAVLINQYLP